MEINITFKSDEEKRDVLLTIGGDLKEGEAIEGRETQFQEGLKGFVGNLYVRGRLKAQRTMMKDARDAAKELFKA